ncbi:MAG: CHASE2 domain-containing protein [Proteobacteria bacterium]|nr:CHASE2 domain-containing protein [Pseudomonadota bacterium]
MFKFHTKQNMLTSSKVSWRWLIASCLIWSGLIIAVQESAVGNYLESHLARPVDFHIRDAAGKSPTLSPRLKIYAIDDSTVGKLGVTVLGLDVWADMINLLVKNRPSAIFIDGMFSLAEDTTGKFKAALASARANHVDVNVGAYFAPFSLKYRDPLELNRPEYQLSNMVGEGATGESLESALPTIVDHRQWFGYGPSLSLRPYIANIGHIIYTDDGHVAPLVRMGDNSALGHLSFYAARDRRIEHNKLVLDGRILPLDSTGSVTVNMPNPALIADAMTPLRTLVELIELGRLSSKVKADDVVLILPLMFTGNVDFHQSPYGYVPGGYILTAMISSVLTGQWLKPLIGAVGLSVILTLLGGFLGMYLSAVLFWIAVAVVMTAGFVASEYLFVYQGMVVPWIFPIVGFFANAITLFAEKTRVGERRTEALRQALEGSVGPTELKHLLLSPDGINFDARERIVTLMFIDIVGFSRIAENMLPRIAFEHLKTMLSTLGETVHEFGGVIDKTLGDGLLCYFGYRFDADTSSPDHAEKALQCALKIQNENLKRNIEAAEHGEPVYPLRIGINTSSVYLGDLGSHNRVDFTVVGNGVNFAKRLEGACEMHSVLLGATTYALVKNIGLPAAATTRRQIRIKHHSELVEAYEYDPFFDRQPLRREAVEGFRKCANIDRIDRRWQVSDPTRIQLTCDFGLAELVNFSYTGVSIRLKQLLVRGTRMTMSIDSGGGALHALLSQEGMNVLHGEVRWGYADGTDFVHGIFITNVTTQQSDTLVQYLCEFALSWEQADEQVGPKAV